MRKAIFIFFISFSLSLISFQTFSQCAMCRRVAETSQSEDNRSARGLNKGILYLLSIPYIMGGIGVYAWYRNRKKE